MKLYVARHGETQWNALNKVCGRTDLPLTELGHRQAQLLAERTAHLGIDVIIASPMLRARQTAKPAAERLGIPVLTDGRLIEQDYGIFEGVDRQDPGFLSNKRQFAYRYPGGESMMDVAHRVYSLIFELKEKYPDKNILLVCHGGVCRIIRTYFEDMTNEEFFRYSEENAAVREYHL
jgi:probable phosphoglycerate mutase